MNLFIAATVLTVAWGTLAFGAVYPWAYTSLGLACAVTGVFGLVLGRRHGNFRSYRWLFLALHGVLAIGLLQLVPLSRPALKALTPATDRFLEGHDFGYAFGGLSERSGLPLAGWHAISIDPALTIRGLELFLAFALFLAGLLLLLTVTLYPGGIGQQLLPIRRWMAGGPFREPRRQTQLEEPSPIDVSATWPVLRIFAASAIPTAWSICVATGDDSETRLFATLP